MPAQLIDGRVIAERIRTRIREKLAAWPAQNPRPALAGVLVGGDDASRMYASAHARSAGEPGIEFRLVDLPAATTLAQVRAEITNLNQDPSSSGIVLYQPLPRHLDLLTLQTSI